MTDDVENEKMSLAGHLDELRRRLIYAVSAVFLLAIVAYAFKEPLLSFLLQPYFSALGFHVPPDRIGDMTSHLRTALEQAQCNGAPCFTPPEIETWVSALSRMLAMLGGLIYTAPIEAFWTFIKFALYMGLLAGMPLVLYQIWKFVVPALYQKEKGYIFSFLSLGSALFYMGAVFSFYFIMPFALQFLVGVGQGLLTPMFSIGNYISFAMLMMIIFGASFEVPLVMFIVVKMGLIKRQTMISNWRYVVVGAFVVGAIVTPPDPITQPLMAGAFLVLYVIGLILTRFAEPKEAIEPVEVVAKE